MSTEKSNETGKTASPLTRADIELLLSKVGPATPLDLSFQNLEHCNLSYLDLQGANLRGANLQGANLRGTKLCKADLREANFSDADLDGADLSSAYLGENEANRIILQRAKLSHTRLISLDLRGFDLTGLDLQNADLNETDLRHAVLLGTNLQGADLSTTRLHGPELRGAVLYRDERLGGRGRQRYGGQKTWNQHTQAIPPQEHFSSPAELAGKPLKKTLSDREASLFGEQVLLAEADPVKIRQLFPQGFAFTRARQLFGIWLAQTGESYAEQEVEAMWIGFAHRICALYYEDEPED